MRNAVLVVVAAVLGMAQPGLGKGLVAEGGGFVLTPEDLRFEVRKLGPSYTYEGTYDERKILVGLLTSRFFLAESALARGYGDEGLSEAVKKAEAGAVGEAYHTWRIEKPVRAPRAESKQVLTKLDRKLHVKEMVFSDYQEAARALTRLEGGESFDHLAASLAGAPGVMVQDPGWRVWREFERSAAVQIFDLFPGQTTGILTSKQGHTIYYVAEDAVWEEAGEELIYLRSRRFVRWRREADISEEVRRDLSQRYAVRYNPEEVRATGEALEAALAGRMPSESLLSPWLLKYEGRDGEVVLNGAYFFTSFWSMPEMSQPYVGDSHAVEQFALDVILPDLESAAGYDLGLGRLRDVAWSAKRAREEYLIPKMEESLAGGVQLVPGEAEHYFQEHRAEMVSKLRYRIRRILVKSSEDAQGVLAELRAGRDFAQVAGERSLDAATAVKGGDLGTVTAGMFKFYDSLAVALDLGEVSDPHTITDGVEIIKLEERTLPRALTFEEARPHVEQVALESKTNRILSDWVEGCKRACDFRLDQDLLATMSLPLPDWRSSVAKESPTEEEPATSVKSGASAVPGGDAGKAKPEGAAKPRPGRRRMIKKLG